MHKLLLIALGGALGTLARYATQSAFAPLSERFPFGTLAANLLGCLAMGLLQGLFAERLLMRPEYRVAVLVGLLGGYTTFATFGWETAALLHGREYWYASVNIIISSIASVAMVLAGYSIGVRL